MVNRLIFFLIFAIALNIDTYAGERFPVPYRPDIDLTKKDVTFECANINFYVDITRPLTPFKKLTLNVNAKKDNTPVDYLKIKAKINMKMDMGNFLYDLSLKKDAYTLNFMLPKCIWGDKRWFIKLIIQDKEYICNKILLFDMEK
ncbi:hypothetical protein DSN97_03210 [Deferribacteraceae bacterium V6Fe1]|nr:hypothetical protein DSN97_03210 [Deferribacteraceae bacterium V6Fe1]